MTGRPVASKDTPAQIEFAWKTHEYVRSMLQFADAKAAVVVAWSSALLGALLSNRAIERVGLSYDGVLSIVSLALMSAAFFVAVFAVVPRLGKSSNERMLYFRCIASYEDAFLYEELVEKLDSRDILREVTHHTSDLASITERKHLLVVRAVWIALAGSAFSTVTVLLA